MQSNYNSVAEPGSSTEACSLMGKKKCCNWGATFATLFYVILAVVMGTGFVYEQCNIYSLREEIKILRNESDAQALVAKTNRMDAQLRAVDSQVKGMVEIVERTEAEVKAVQQTQDDLTEVIAKAKSSINDQVDKVMANLQQYMSDTNHKLNQEDKFIKYQLAGTFTLLATIMTVWHALGHVRNFARPHVQRRVLAILWLIPVFALSSWLSLIFSDSQDAQEWLDLFKDSYEAYAIYTFVMFLFAVLSDDGAIGFEGVVDILAPRMAEIQIKPPADSDLSEALAGEPSACETDDEIVVLPSGQEELPQGTLLKPFFPCCYNKEDARSMAGAYIFQCWFCVMQFIVLRPPLSAVGIFMHYMGRTYGKEPYMINGWPNPKCVSLYVLILENFSVMLAFYGLVKFYKATNKELAWCDPWPKFMCIKGVVFMTFYQNLALTIMSHFGWVSQTQAQGAQHLLLCVEMLLAAVAYKHTFPYQEWQPGYKKSREKAVAVRDMLALRDLAQDFLKMSKRKGWESGRGLDPEISQRCEVP